VTYEQYVAGLEAIVEQSPERDVEREMRPVATVEWRPRGGWWAVDAEETSRSIGSVNPILRGRFAFDLILVNGEELPRGTNVPVGSWTILEEYDAEAAATAEPDVRVDPGTGKCRVYGYLGLRPLRRVLIVTTHARWSKLSAVQSLGRMASPSPRITRPANQIRGRTFRAGRRLRASARSPGDPDPPPKPPPLGRPPTNSAATRRVSPWSRAAGTSDLFHLPASQPTERPADLCESTTRTT
jgi:hypothetical protein